MAELRPYEPTWRDRIARALMGDAAPSPERRAFVEGLTGSSGLGTKGLGVVDALMVPGAVLGAQEAAQGGDYRGAILGAMAGGPAAKINRTMAGWTFRDVMQPHSVMGRGDWAKYSRAMDAGDWREVELPIRSMYATQHNVNPDFMKVTATNDTLPIVMKKNGQYFVQDGHHRLTAAAESGRQTAAVRLIDLDGNMEDAPLLSLTK